MVVQCIDASSKDKKLDMDSCCSKDNKEQDDVQKKSTNISLKKNQKQIKSKNKLCLADFVLIDFCLKRREITRDG